MLFFLNFSRRPILLSSCRALLTFSAVHCLLCSMVTPLTSTTVPSCSSTRLHSLHGLLYKASALLWFHSSSDWLVPLDFSIVKAMMMQLSQSLWGILVRIVTYGKGLWTLLHPVVLSSLRSSFSQVCLKSYSKTLWPFLRRLAYATAQVQCQLYLLPYSICIFHAVELLKLGCCPTLISIF